MARLEKPRGIWAGGDRGEATLGPQGENKRNRKLPSMEARGGHLSKHYRMNGRRTGVILEQEEGQIEVLLTPKRNQQGRLQSLTKLCHKISREGS